MEWFLYAIIGAFLTALHFAIIKKYVKDMDQFLTAAGIFFFAFIILFIISYFKGFPAIQKEFYTGLIITGCLNVVANSINFWVLKHHDLSATIPMISFTPVFLIFTSYLIE